MTHGTAYAYGKRKCRCVECRGGNAGRRRQQRAGRREHNVPCLICDEWFGTEGSRNSHETRVHG